MDIFLEESRVSRVELNMLLELELGHILGMRT